MFSFIATNFRFAVFITSLLYHKIVNCIYTYINIFEIVLMNKSKINNRNYYFCYVTIKVVPS